MTFPGDAGTALPTPRDVDAAAGGDRAAVRRVLGMLRVVVVRYCRGRLGLGRAADEAAAEIARRLGDQLARHGDSDPPFLALAYRITVDVTDAVEVSVPAGAEAREAGAAVPRRMLRVVPDLPAAPHDRPRVGPAMSALLRMLPADLREVLVLRVAAGLSAGEVAELVGLSPEAVRVTQHRALAQLRALPAGPAAAQA